MSWVDKLLSIFKKDKKSPKEVEESPKEEINPLEEQDTRKVLKDSEGNDLICALCENWDNEFNKYYPIHEGEQKTFDGKKWHLDCFRAFMKEARRGNLI